MTQATVHQYEIAVSVSRNEFPEVKGIDTLIAGQLAIGNLDVEMSSQGEKFPHSSSSAHNNSVYRKSCLYLLLSCLFAVLISIVLAFINILYRGLSAQAVMYDVILLI